MTRLSVPLSKVFRLAKAALSLIGYSRRNKRIGYLRRSVWAIFRRCAQSTLLNKVPEVTMIFWIIKIMSTTVGETGADYLAVHVGLGTRSPGRSWRALLIAAFVVQVRARRYCRGSTG